VPSHEHGPHSHEHAPEHTGNLLLDIGGDTGALVIQAAADRDQDAIEITPAGREEPRTHNVVRQRVTTPGRFVYAAVFPALPAGDYDVWRDEATRAGTASVRGGQVASFTLG
jgi:hypothetical protein